MLILLNVSKSVDFSSEENVEPCVGAAMSKKWQVVNVQPRKRHWMYFVDRGVQGRGFNSEIY